MGVTGLSNGIVIANPPVTGIAFLTHHLKIYIYLGISGLFLGM